MPLTKEQRAQLDELKALEAEEAKAEETLKELDAQKKEEQANRQKALRDGDKEAAKEAKVNIETVSASESTVQALIEQLKRQEAYTIMLLEEKGVAKEKIEEVKRRRFIGPPR